MVRNIALNVMDMLEAIQLRKRTRRVFPFHPFQKPQAQTHWWIFSENANMPIMHPTDNCKLTEVIAMGLQTNMINTATLSDVGGSSSRNRLSDKISKICITQARVTDGVKPVTAAKKINVGMPISAMIGRFLPAMT